MPQPGICRLFALITPLLLVPPAGAAAEVRLRGDYVVSLFGITIGRGGWDVRIAAGHYIATGQGRSAGLAVLVSSGQGQASADGAIQGGKPGPRRYDYTSTTTQKYDEIHFQLQNGLVRDLRIDPPQGRHRKRVPLEPRHMENVFDPIGGLLMPNLTPIGPTPIGPTPIGPATCARVLPVFDGRMRYDLHFSFLRMEQVKTDIGYAGPVAVCAVRFVPLAGHVPNRPAIQYMMGLTTMEIWLAPVAGTALAVPWKIVIPTPYGTALLEAESFQITEE